MFRRVTADMEGAPNRTEDRGAFVASHGRTYMGTTAHSRQGRGEQGWGLLVLVALALSSLRAEEHWVDNQVLPPNACILAQEASVPVERSQRIRLFRIQPAFLTDPVGLEDEPPSGDPARLSVEPLDPPEAGTERIQFAMGADNPYFDFRQPGDPGGLGFYRVNTQVQLFDSDRTGCTLGVQAVTPAGIQYAGVDNGPTVVSPSFCLFHALDDGTAIQGFVGKNVPVANAATGPLQRDLQYGMAVQRSLAKDALGNLYVYLGALGKYRLERDASRSPSGFEVLPGLHWKVADNWWMTGGVIVPVGSTRADTNLWQVTCSFQF